MRVTAMGLDISDCLPNGLNDAAVAALTFVTLAAAKRRSRAPTARLVAC